MLNALSSLLSTKLYRTRVIAVLGCNKLSADCHSLINRSQKNADTVRGYILLSEILAAFSMAPVLHFDERSISIFHELRKQQVRISTMDLRIASIALANNLTLLTRNRRDFNKVPDLILEDWTV
ncbi:MAG: type II toxin-antitoxin system VapC family toxin [Cyanobacteria bacterium J06607_10]